MSFPELTAPAGEPCPAPQHPKSEAQLPHVSASSALIQAEVTDPRWSLLHRTWSKAHPAPKPRTIKPLTTACQPALWTPRLPAEAKALSNHSHSLMLAPFVTFNNPGSLAAIRSHQLCAPVVTSSAPVMLREIPLEMVGALVQFPAGQ